MRWTSRIVMTFAFTAAAAVAAGLLGGAFLAQAEGGPRQNPSGDATYDDLLLRVEQRAPGFGGMFIDAEGRLAVYLLDMAQLPAARSAIEAVFGASQLPAAGVRALQGQYTVSQLKQWFDRTNTLLALPGVSMVDLDEARNRVTIGVEDGSRTRAVEQALARLGIPREVVIIEATGPIVPLQQQ